MKEQRIPLGPCPHCGKPESARMGFSGWGHDFSCCDDKCGRAFANSPKRWALEVARASEAADDAQAHLAWTKRQLRDAGAVGHE